jgi:hypothetical protein
MTVALHVSSLAAAQSPSAPSLTFHTPQPKFLSLKNDLKEIKKFLESLDYSKLKKVYGVGKFEPWEGDNNSQSGGSIFQILSEETTGKDHKYITIVRKKKTTDALVTHESHSWEESAKKIVEEIITELVRHHI